MTLITIGKYVLILWSALSVAGLVWLFFFAKEDECHCPHRVGKK